MAKWRDLGLTYSQALHGVQSGVAYEHANGSSDGSPKHLRTGVNSSLVTQAAIVQLLINKGIISEDEYREELRLAMNDEVATYEDRNKPLKFR